MIERGDGRPAIERALATLREAYNKAWEEPTVPFGQLDIIADTYTYVQVQAMARGIGISE